MWMLALMILVVTGLMIRPETAHGASVGNISDFVKKDNNTFEITSGSDKIKVIFQREDMFRIWLGVNGQFKELTGKSAEKPIEPIVIKDDFGPVNVKWSDEGTYYKYGNWKIRAESL